MSLKQAAFYGEASRERGGFLFFAFIGRLLGWLSGRGTLRPAHSFVRYRVTRCSFWDPKRNRKGSRYFRPRGRPGLWAARP